MFDHTAFDKLASISHFLDAFTDKNVSGIEVIAASKIRAITKYEIHKLSPINSAEWTDNSTQI
jgi:hypothetical protein